MRKALSLNPILIILGILIGAKIAGVLGIIIITPILGSIVETIKLLKTDKKI
jgi:predicted PurR-regulated permease PerM